MKSKTLPASGSPLAQLLPDAQFGSEHCGIVNAPREQVWDALHNLRWSDLRLAKPFMRMRGFGVPVGRDRVYETFTARAGAVLVEEPPAAAWLAMIGKPWQPIPRHAPAATPDDIAAFADPGWLKYGMEWQLYALGDDRTLVETRTLCQATDAGARRAFQIYWTLIRLGSSAIRLDMISALQRLITAHDAIRSGG